MIPYPQKKMECFLSLRFEATKTPCYRAHEFVRKHSHHSWRAYTYKHYSKSFGKMAESKFPSYCYDLKFTPCIGHGISPLHSSFSEFRGPQPL